MPGSTLENGTPLYRGKPVKDCRDIIAARLPRLSGAITVGDFADIVSKEQAEWGLDMLAASGTIRKINRSSYRLVAKIDKSDKPHLAAVPDPVPMPEPMPPVVQPPPMTDTQRRVAEAIHDATGRRRDVLVALKAFEPEWLTQDAVSDAATLEVTSVAKILRTAMEEDGGPVVVMRPYTGTRALIRYEYALADNPAAADAIPARKLKKQRSIAADTPTAPEPQPEPQPQPQSDRTLCATLAKALSERLACVRTEASDLVAIAQRAHNRLKELDREAEALQAMIEVYEGDLDTPAV